MATKKKRVPDGDVTLAVLKDIRRTLQGHGALLAEQGGKLDALSGKVDDHGAKLDAVASISLTLIDRVDRLQDETMKGFTGVRRDLDGVNRRGDQTNARLEALRDTVGEKIRGHDRRLDAVEIALAAGKDPRRP